MDYRNILATGFLLLCAGYFFRSLQPANATLPPYPVGTSYNGYPYESIQCNGCTQSTPFLTVPSNKYFIITTAHVVNSICDLYIDNIPVEYVDNPIFRNGKLKLLASPNSTISSGTNNCYIEGYYAEANNNNLVSLYGEVAANSSTSIVTVPNDKNLIITGAAINRNAYQVSIYSDSNLIILGINIWANEASYNDNRHLIIPPGTVLSIQNTHPSESVSYYLQGHYAPL